MAEWIECEGSGQEPTCVVKRPDVKTKATCRVCSRELVAKRTGPGMFVPPKHKRPGDWPNDG